MTKKRNRRDATASVEAAADLKREAKIDARWERRHVGLEKRVEQLERIIGKKALAVLAKG